MTIDYIGEIHPFTASNYGFKDGVRVYIAVLDIPSILDFVTFDRKHEGVTRFPAVSRDISMLVPKATPAGDIENMIRRMGGNLLESTELFDIYEGEQVREGYKSMAYSLSFRAKDHTLTDDEIVSAMNKVLEGLSSMNIELRS